MRSFRPTRRTRPSSPAGTGGRAPLRLALLLGAAVLVLPAALAASPDAATPAAPLLVIPPVRDDLSAKDLARVRAITAPATEFAKPERFEGKPGGATTSTAQPDRDAFSHPSANLDFAARDDFFVGNGFFRKVWVSSPSSTQASDGLGPFYNARACQLCHLKDGRGSPPAPGETAQSMFLRLNVPASDDAAAQELATLATLRLPEPTYGGQLQHFAVPGLKAEGRMTVRYDEVPVALAGGETASLRHPAYGVEDLGYGPLAPGTRLSPRVAPPMIGVGLLEAIHPADIAAGADPDDADGDGISGKLPVSRDPETGSLALGRFGWKAETPSVRVQSAEAFSGDIGISTPLVTDAFGECSVAQTVCRDAPSGVQPQRGDVEAPDPILSLVTFYSQNLAVPARRNVDDAAVLAGKTLFYAAGCIACHTPKFVTRRDAAVPALRFQLIWPYSDMLLHDMGDGLADGFPVGVATGREFRTQPLWGIGLTKAVNGHTFLLHDGRARNVLEAILWHGGEAQAARDRVVAMSPDDRRALLAFLDSL